MSFDPHQLDADTAPSQCVGADPGAEQQYMSILGVIVRSHPDTVAAIDQRLRGLPGVDVADLAGAPDGRVVIVIEDSATSTAPASLRRCWWRCPR